jgi:hypothetical protein
MDLSFIVILREARRPKDLVSTVARMILKPAEEILQVVELLSE